MVAAVCRNALAVERQAGTPRVVLLRASKSPDGSKGRIIRRFVEAASTDIASLGVNTGGRDATMSKNRRKGTRKRGEQYSRVDQHKREGKRLIPPLAQISQMQLHSWRDDRLPQMIWTALLTLLKRKGYLEIFRSVAHQGQELGKAFDGRLEHSALAKLEPDVFDKLLAPVLHSAEAKAVLNPLLLFDQLPDKHHWERHITKPADATPLEEVARAVAQTSFHQSEAATDIRWLRVLSMIAADRMKFPHEMAERVQEIFEFPYRGDLRQVRPSIRATEGAFANPEMGGVDDKWPEEFWRECWEHTHCIVAPRNRVDSPATKNVVKQLVEIYRASAAHFLDNTTNTNLDARKDATFGLVFYGLNLAITLNSGPAQHRAEGRLLIRTLVECVVTLAFLVHKDQDALWMKYRQYGSGQAKLAFLKLVDLDAGDLPGYVNVDELEELANEDVWQEFQNVDLGSWASSDLRKMSEEAGLKPVYDKYYGWPSGFVHGQWAAVRDTTFDQCLNPLHRLHRVPSTPRMDMGTVALDSVRLANLLLDQLNAAYPPFKSRITLPIETEVAAEVANPADANVAPVEED